VLIIGTPSRFQRGKQIGNYVGMIPSEESSGGKQRLGHISKQGSSLLRFLLVEAAQAAVRIHPDWRRRYMHLAIRRHKSIAKVAMGDVHANRLFGTLPAACFLRKYLGSSDSQSLGLDGPSAYVALSHPLWVGDATCCFKAFR
jgi:Transposase IS116/IS110/IS902 family